MVDELIDATIVVLVVDHPEEDRVQDDDGHDDVVKPLVGNDPNHFEPEAVIMRKQPHRFRRESECIAVRNELAIRVQNFFLLFII